MRVKLIGYDILEPDRLFIDRLTIALSPVPQCLWILGFLLQLNLQLLMGHHWFGVPLLDSYNDTSNSNGDPACCGSHPTALALWMANEICDGNTCIAAMFWSVRRISTAPDHSTDWTIMRRPVGHNSLAIQWYGTRSTQILRVPFFGIPTHKPSIKKHSLYRNLPSIPQIVSKTSSL